MRITISVGGRFHAFNLAGELERRSHLLRLITSYPASRVTPFGVPKEKVRSVFLKEVMERSFRSLPEPLQRFGNPQYLIHDFFDRAASRRIPRETDILAGWSSFSLRTFRAAKALGAKTVVDRGSSHMRHQKRILEEEYGRWGLRPRDVPHPKVFEKELAEYEEADRIAVPSLFVKRTFIDEGVAESKLIHVPYGVDLAAFRPGKKEDDVFRVMYVGGMTLQKGIPYLLQAFAELRLPKAELLLLGNANDEIQPFFRTYAGAFRHVSAVPQHELVRFYNQGSVFVLPSVQDGFGMVIAQAMAAGLPVIATENTGGPDIIEEGKSGFIVPIRSVEALKEKLLWFYDHPEERQAMGDAAAARVASGFTWSDYGGRMVAAYEALLGAA